MGTYKLATYETAKILALHRDTQNNYIEFTDSSYFENLFFIKKNNMPCAPYSVRIHKVDFARK